MWNPPLHHWSIKLPASWFSQVLSDSWPGLRNNDVKQGWCQSNKSFDVQIPIMCMPKVIHCGHLYTNAMYHVECWLINSNLDYRCTVFTRYQWHETGVQHIYNLKSLVLKFSVHRKCIDTHRTDIYMPRAVAFESEEKWEVCEQK